MTTHTLEPSPTPGATARDPYQPFRRLLLSEERVRELSRLRPERVLSDTARCWLAILAAWWAAARWPAWWMIAAAVVVVGTSFYALFIIGHDALHRRLFTSRRRNDLFADLLIFGPIGGVTRLNNRNHLLHHHHLASDGDPDRHRHDCFNKAGHFELFLFVVGATSFVRSAANVFRTPPPARHAAGNDRRTYTGRDLAVLLGWQALLIAGLSLAIGWWAYPVLWLLPVYLHAFLGDNLRSFLEHSHPEPAPLADSHRLISYRSSPIERWLIAPMNMNFHAAHHLWPSIPYYHLPLADREMRRRAEGDLADQCLDLHWRNSYLGYLVDYWRALPLLECRAAGGRASTTS